MTQITEDYVSFEIAKLLKEKGFDVPVYQYYFPPSNDNLNYSEFDNDWNSVWEHSYSAPTLQMALKWLREVHHLQICISSYSNRWEEYVHGWQFLIKKLTFTEGIGWNWDDSLDAITDKKMSDDITYATYEEACENAIKYCLKNLI